MAEALIKPDQIASMLAQLRSLLADWVEPQPPFQFEIGWSSSYERLLLEEFDLGITSATEILTRALESGRVLISGRAGAAKTTVVYRLVRELLSKQSVLPIVLNLKEWQAPFYADWSTLPEDFTFRLNFLLERLAVPRISLAILDSIDPRVFRVLLMDGLNEITPRIAQEIISVFDEYVRRASQSAVIITDRVVRRSFADVSRWRLCALKPLADDEIRTQLQSQPEKLQAFDASLGGHRQLFRIPLFLDLFLRSARLPGGLLTTEEEMRYYFEEQIGLTDEEIAVAARAAFEIYQSQQARTFPIATLQDKVGQEITAKLAASSIKVTNDGSAYFFHHLHHDYLVARYIASNESQWTQEGFDALTFKAASFDSLALALEQLRTSDQADRFIQALYDWNVYAPAYALAEAHQGGLVVVSPDMQRVVYAMLAEKRWDFMLQTSERASDALSVFPEGSDARELLALGSLEDLLNFVKALHMAGNRYAKWQTVFCSSADTSLEPDVFREITAPDSIIGWTLANVLKRTITSMDRQQELRDWAKQRGCNSTVIWRIVHVLGAFPTEQNFKFLLDILDTHTVIWPRYGALRSLVELAGKSPQTELRTRVFEALSKRVAELSSSHLLLELQRALFVRNAPPGWAQAAFPLVNSIYERQTQEED